MNQRSLVLIMAAASAAAILMGAVYALGLGNAGHAMAATAGTNTTQTVEVTYLGTKTVQVATMANGTSVALCKIGDIPINGGYDVGISSISSSPPGSMFVSSNTPVLLPTTNGQAEGWQTSLVNNGSATVSLTTHVLCSGLRAR